MAEKTINTRLVIRNDYLSAWEKSEKTLLKGEMALARLSGDQDGCYKVRIGTGDKTWNQLSDQGQLIIPAANVEGLNAAIAALSTSYYETDDITKLSATYVNGDIAVEKKLISGELSSYTAYRYDKTDGKWKALDGNYSADNVYFSKDITLAGDYGSTGRVGNIKLSDGTLAASGKSVKTLFDNIFTQELTGSATKPAFTFTVSGSENAAEVGTTYTVPAAVFKYTSTGSYTYAPTNAACEISAGQVTIQRTTSGEETTITNSTAIAKNEGLTCNTGSTGVTLLDYADRVTYNYKLSAEHTQGVMPKTNLGNDAPSIRIAAGDNWSSGSKTASATFYGYRNMWVGSTTGTETITEAVIKGLSKKAKSAAVTYTVKASGGDVALVSGAKRIIVALPQGRSLSQVLLVSASNTPITDDYTKNHITVSVGGAVDGQNLMTYNVYVYQPASIDSGEVHAITIA